MVEITVSVYRDINTDVNFSIICQLPSFHVKVTFKISYIHT